MARLGKLRGHERNLLNPKGPRRGNGTPNRVISIPIPQTAEWDSILKDYKFKLAALEDSSLAHVYRDALIEYHQRHIPGNPGLPLNHWIDGEPFSEAAREKLRKRATVTEKGSRLSDEDFERLFPEHARRIREEAEKRK